MSLHNRSKEKFGLFFCYIGGKVRQNANKRLTSLRSHDYFCKNYKNLAYMNIFLYLCALNCIMRNCVHTPSNN